MVTTVGTEANFNTLVENLLLLEHAAIAAYDQTIGRLENPDYKMKVAQFRDDHMQHVQQLTKLAAAVGAPNPREGNAKEMLTTGKIALASLMGDSAILKAMRSNEEDTVTAYGRASKHPQVHPEARSVFESAYGDELRHREWMMQTSSS